MRTVLAALVALTVSAACGGEPLPPEHPTKGKRTVAKGHHGSESTREAADPDAVSGRGKEWGGWRYAGSRDDCFFVVGRRCFAEEAAACKHAKCDDGRCLIEGGGPATVRCR